jgi:methylase of polypeptide subunit release factors
MSILNKNGFMLLEFGGASQVDEIVNIFQKHPYRLEFHNDLQGDPRILEVKLTA